MRIVPFRHGSISQRVVRAVTLTVAFFLGLQAVLAYLTMHAQEDDLSDELLRQEVRQLISSTARPGLTPEGPLAAAPRVSAYLARGQRGEAALPSYLRGLAPACTSATPTGAPCTSPCSTAKTAASASPSTPRSRNRGCIGSATR